MSEQSQPVRNAKQEEGNAKQEEGNAKQEEGGRLVRVARVRDIPEGGLHRVEVGHELICLARVGGVVYAVSDDCPHIGGALSDGELEGCVLTCPVHLAQFDVRSGKVLRGPARDNVPVHSVHVEGDYVYIRVPK